MDDHQHQKQTQEPQDPLATGQPYKGYVFSIENPQPYLHEVVARHSATRHEIAVYRLDPWPQDWLDYAVRGLMAEIDARTGAHGEAS